MKNSGTKDKKSGPGSEGVLFVILILAIAALIFVSYATKEQNIREPKRPQEQKIATETIDPEIASLMQRLERNPEDVGILKELGNRFYDAGNFAMAEMFYRKVLEVTPEDTDVIVDLGTSYFYTQRGEAAMQRYEEALRIDPAHKNAIFNMGVVKDAMGDRKGALVWWGRYAELADEDDPHIEFIRKMITEDEVGKKEGGTP